MGLADGALGRLRRVGGAHHVAILEHGAFAFEGPEDVFVPLARAAGVADLDLYSNVAIAFPRSPMHLAHLAWDLAAMSNGRFALGLGTQIQAHIERRYGSTWSAPVDRMAEWVDAIRSVIAVEGADEA